MRSSASLISDKDRWPRLALIVLAVGVASRAWGYLSAGSLWLDELFLASSFRHLSYQELLGPLRDSQTAPVAWLWIEKTVWNGLGSHELALRLPSLVASILTLPLTFLVARRLLRARWAVLPLFLVAVSPYAVWQAFQVKPYSFDLLVAVTLAWFAIAVLDRQIWAWPSIAVVGTVAVFVSMPSIFVLVAIVVVLVAATILDRSQTRPRWIVIATALTWCVAFLVNYRFFLRPGERPEWLYDYWSAGLFSFQTLGDFLWWPRVLGAAMGDPVGFVGIGWVAAVPVVLSIAIWLLGSVRELIERRRFEPRRLVFGIVFLPILVTLGAATIGAYPFAKRLILFLVPFLAIAFAHGLAGLAGRWPKIATAVLVSFLLVPSFWFLLWLPRGGLPLAADTRALFAQLETRHGGEPILLDHQTAYAWRHYRPTIDGEIVKLKAAWNHRDRSKRIAEALATVDQDEAWVVIARTDVVGRSGEPNPTSPLGRLFYRDLTAGDLTFATTYRAWIGRDVEWTPIDELRGGLSGWRIIDEWNEYGVWLAKVHRASSETT